MRLFAVSKFICINMKHFKSTSNDKMHEYVQLLSCVCLLSLRGNLWLKCEPCSRMEWLDKELVDLSGMRNHYKSDSL